VIWTLLYVKPRDFFKSLSPRNIKKNFRDNILLSKEKNSVIVFSVMLGLFMGIVPVWGYQMIIAFMIAVFFRLNKFIVLASSNISIPPCIPFIIFGSYYLGGFFVPDTYVKHINLSTIHSLSAIKENVIQYVIGSFALAVCAALAGGAFTYVMLKLFRSPVKDTAGSANSSNGKRYGKA
jgi:uncharacterized protein (DUF2062 family)